MSEKNQTGALAQPAQEPSGTIWCQFAAIYKGLDAEDCAYVDREWAKWRGLTFASQPPAAPVETKSVLATAVRQEEPATRNTAALLAQGVEGPHLSADTETITEGCADEHCEFFEMLWKWFADEKRHGKAEMRANNLDGGLSAADFEEMLNEHEANIMHVQPQAVRWCTCKASTRDGQHMGWCPALSRPHRASEGE